VAEREAGLQAYLEGLEGLVPPALRDAAQKAAVRHFFGRRWDSLLQASQPFIILLPPPLSPPYEPPSELELLGAYRVGVEESHRRQYVDRLLGDGWDSLSTLAGASPPKLRSAAPHCSNGSCASHIREPLRNQRSLWGFSYNQR
jgi:hypothetical protein